MNSYEVIKKSPVLMPDSFSMLQIGITTLCNQLCAHCPRETKRKGMSTMTLEQFEHYLDQFDPLKFRNFLVSDFGEITIVPQCLDYLRAAKRRGFRGVHFVTNGSKKNASFWRAIAQEGLISYLIVSLEAAEDPLYDRIRGQSFEYFTEVVKIIHEEFNNAKRKIPIILNAVCMRSNLHQIPKIAQFACDMNIKELALVHLNGTAPIANLDGKLCIPEEQLDTVDRSEVVEVFRNVMAIAKQGNLKVWLPEEYPELQETVSPLPTEPSAVQIDPSKPLLRCGKPLEWIQVGLTGNVFPCCQMSQRYSCGNLNDSSFSEIWQGEKYETLFDGLRPGGVPIQVCSECNILRGKRF